MLQRFLFAALVSGFVLGNAPPASADDFEDSLLKKFQRQNQKGTQSVKDDVESNLLKVTTMAPVQPEKALDLLRQTRDLLDAAQGLSKADRDALNRKLEDGFKDVKARIESKQERARVPPEPSDGQQQFFPGNGIVTSQAQFSTTPIVSADRRWVRIGVSGTFSGLSSLFFQQRPVRVPQVFQGPGRGFTIRP